MPTTAELGQAEAGTGTRPGSLMWVAKTPAASPGTRWQEAGVGAEPGLEPLPLCQMPAP